MIYELKFHSLAELNLTMKMNDHIKRLFLD